MFAGREHPLVTADYAGATGAASTTSILAAPVGQSVGFAAGSFIMPTDGSETPIGMIPDGSGLKVTDEDSVSVDTPLPKLLIGGAVDTNGIVNYPTDTSLITWLKAALRAVGGAYSFSDDF